MVCQLIQQGGVDVCVVGDLRLPPGHLQVDLCAGLHEHKALLAPLRYLLPGTELAHALDPVVLAKLLVDAEIAHALAEVAVGDAGQQGALFGGEVDGIQRIHIVR